jgi:hypothetical protein
MKSSLHGFNESIKKEVKNYLETLFFYYLIKFLRILVYAIPQIMVLCNLGFFADNFTTWGITLFSLFASIMFDQIVILMFSQYDAFEEITKNKRLRSEE